MENMKEKILLSMGLSSLVLNNYSFIKENIDRVNKAKSKLKYKKDLCMESKEGLRVLNKEVFKNVFYLNIASLYIELIPVFNMLSSIYLFNRGEDLSLDIGEIADFIVDEINKIEDVERSNYGKMYKELVSNLGLEPLLDIDAEELKLSYKELKKLCKNHNVELSFVEIENLEEDNEKQLKYNKKD